MKYVKRYWIPVVLVIAFLAATIRTTSGNYPVEPTGRTDWVVQHQEKHLATLGAKEMDDRYLADSLSVGENLELQLWRFEVDGRFYNDIILWKQNSAGNYKAAYEYCIAQAAVTSPDGAIEYSFQQGLHKYSGMIDDQFHIQSPERTLSLGSPLLSALLAVGYIALIVVALRYYRTRKERKEAEKDRD